MTKIMLKQIDLNSNEIIRSTSNDNCNKSFEIIEREYFQCTKLNFYDAQHKTIEYDEKYHNSILNKINENKLNQISLRDSVYIQNKLGYSTSNVFISIYFQRKIRN